ncbi:MAG: DUF885 domain-containing protein [bacterium]|nr:DUF885 domain-containing protein [bacterium]
MSLMSSPLALTAILCCAACAATQTSRSDTASARLQQLFSEEWEARLADDPLLATAVGRRGAGELPSVRPEGLARRANAAERLLERLGEIDPDRLGGADRVSYAVFRGPREMPFETAADYEAYIARMHAFPDWVEQHVANMRAGLARGMCLPRVVLQGYGGTASAHVVDDPEKSLFYAPFQEFPDSLPASARTRLIADGRAAIENGVVPGHAAFLRFLEDEYVPRTRETLACSELPDGRAYYDWLVRHFTTLEIKPEEVHRIGLEEVARIHSEMQAVIDGTGFEGDFAAFLEFLRTDPRFYAETPEALRRRALPAPDRGRRALVV